MAGWTMGTEAWIWMGAWALVMVLVVWLAMALRGAARSPILVALLVGTGTFAMFSGDLAGNGEFWMFSALAVAMLPIGGRGAKRGVGAVGDG